MIAKIILVIIVLNLILALIDLKSSRTMYKGKM